jgi:hypothetical protein
MFLIISCSSATPATKSTAAVLLLDYQDFGPQVIAHELIGMEWYQWNATGDEKLRDPIVVVVYRAQDEKDVRKLYPVDRATKHDYRYVSQKAATDFLHSQIDDLNRDRDIDATLRKELLQTYRATLGKIENMSVQK